MSVDRWSLQSLSPHAWAYLAAALGWVVTVQAENREDMWRMMGSTVRSEEKGVDVTWFLVVAALLIAVIILFTRLHRTPHTRETHTGTRHRTPRRSFSEQAGAMGFKPVEVSNLRRIASRLSGGGDPVSILTSSAGRQFLTADLRKRIRRREREIALLTGMLKKLGARADHAFHDRGSIRVEADIAIWLVKKGEEEDLSGGDEIVADVAPTSGRLLDLSEGGAAIRADIDLEAGDVVEFWSADTQVWIPPTQSGVVNTRRDDDGGTIVNLHFLDPPRTEIRRAIQEIQRSEREDLDDIYSGPNGDGSA